MTNLTVFIKKKKKIESSLPRLREPASFLFTGWPTLDSQTPQKILSKVNHIQAGEPPGIMTCTWVTDVTPRQGRTIAHSKDVFGVSQHTMELHRMLTEFSYFDSTQRARCLFSL